jgi:tetratricopeptide (TPR) repeat protein
MLATSLNALVFYPFLAIATAVALWGLVLLLRSQARTRTESKARRLAQAGRFDDLVAFLAGRDQSEKAAALLAEHGQTERAVEILVATGAHLAAARLASGAGEHQRAGELFQRGGDLASAGACYLASGDYDAAVRLLRQAGELRTAARFLEQRSRPDMALKIYLEVGEFKRAAALARTHLKERIHLKIVADALVDKEQWELATELYVKGNYFLEAGRTLERRGQLDAAVKAYLQQNYFAEAAGLLARLGRHREAAENFMKGGLVSKAVEEMLLAGEFLAVARLYRRSEQPARALDVLDRIPLGAPDHRAAQLMAATIEEENHRFADAASRLQRFLSNIRYQGENLELIYRVVDLHIILGDKEAAIYCLEQAKRSGVSDPDLDEQLMRLREAPASLFEPEPPDETTAPAHRRARFRGDTTTVGFPRSDRYILKRKLARGGHGILFLVEDTRLERDVVLKLLHSESLPSDLARKYFFREARTAAGLNHPNIVRVFDYGEIEKRPYLAMEYVDGLNLLELQESLPDAIPFDRCLAICIELCEALEYAHDKTIIHRDIKMENVMVNTQWHTKLMDFGLAKALNENPDRSLFIIGTPFYMSPEQIIGDTLDHRTDIYSVGVLMYRLFTGRLPFEEGEILSHHRFSPPPDPREFNPLLPRPLAETILTCLKKDREERFDSARLIGQRLAQLRPPGQ